MEIKNKKVTILNIDTQTKETYILENFNKQFINNNCQTFLNIISLYGKEIGHRKRFAIKNITKKEINLKWHINKIRKNILHEMENHIE
jgi:CTP:phosphocholine cytidylyltransferase-like protein